MKINLKLVIIALLFKCAIMKQEDTPAKPNKDQKNQNTTDNTTEVDLDPCLNYTDCFNCSFAIGNNYRCNWNGTTCLKGYKQYNKGDWRKKYVECEDEASKMLIGLYCDNEIKETLKTSNNFKNLITLPLSPYGKYGTQNIVCGWLSVENAIGDGLLYLYISKNESVQIGIEMKFLMYSRFENIKGPEINMTIAGVKSISFYYHGYEDYDEPPFEMYFEFQQYNTTRLLMFSFWFICVICVGFLIGTFVFFVFFLSKKVMYKEYKQEMKKETSKEKTSSKEEENECTNTTPLTQKCSNRQLIKLGIYCEALCKSNTNCPICFELFIIGGKIIILNCSHLFHRDCFNTWKAQVKQKFFCPVCHQEKLEENIKKQSEASGLLINININNV